MPELPEVECVVRALEGCLPSQKITGVEFFYDRMLPPDMDRDTFSRSLQGREVLKIKRLGKYILIHLSGGMVLEVHLRMTGRFLYTSEGVPVSPYTGAVFKFEGGCALHFQDMRKFGTFRLWEQDVLSSSPAYRLGPDPLSPEFSFSSFSNLLERKKKVRIKPFLLNQQNLAGLGNIYTDEALYRARIHPSRLAGSLADAEKKRLFKAINTVLQESIGRGGTTFSDYRNLQGEVGLFQEQLEVYRRDKQKCLRCSTPIARIVICGRGTYYCPSCQQPQQ